MDENDIMVDEEMNENVEEAIDETSVTYVVEGLIALAALTVGVGAIVVSKTKWGKRKIKELRTNHARKVLEKYADDDSDDSEKTIPVEHFVVEDEKN